MVTEAALWWRPADWAVQAEQIRAVAAATTRPNVDLRVLLLDAQAPTFYHSFTILDDQLVTADGLGSIRIHDPEEIAWQIEVFTRMQQAALDPTIRCRRVIRSSASTSALFRYSVFRLETLQTYAGSGEDGRIAAFGRGDPEPPPDPAEDRWAAMLRANSAAGRTQQRVHVITEPISDYLAYELTWEYGPHTAAGEDIRIIPVTTGWPADVPAQDFWLFDATILFDMRYHSDGRWRGIEPVTDAARVAAACFARDAALHQSIPWRTYLAGYPELARRLMPAWL